MSGETVLRPVSADDLPAILSVEASCRSVTWTPRGFAQDLSDKNLLGLVALSAGSTVCGYVLSRCAADECTVHTIAVLPSCRRRGIGTKLLQALIARASERRVATLFLEVRGKNAGAQAFYASLGFAPCGTRKAYYSDDNDDAVIMRRRLNLSA
jgi:ribosomal-protein-alanine N-acetyltransferase